MGALALGPPVSGLSLREPEKERRTFRRSLWVLGAVVTASLVVAGAVVVTTQEPQYRYRFTLSFTNPSNHPYTAYFPLPADPEVQASCRWVGNISARIEPSSFGTALRVQGIGGVGMYCDFDAHSLKVMAFTTEGLSASGAIAARVFLDSGETANAASLNLSYNETGKEWVTSRFVQGAVEEGWSAMEISETLVRIQSRT